MLSPAEVSLAERVVGPLMMRPGYTCEATLAWSPAVVAPLALHLGAAAIANPRRAIVQLGALWNARKRYAG